MRWIVILFCLIAGPATAQFNNCGAGFCKVKVSAGYTGPGDIVSFTSWWGLRAYNAANATAHVALFDICDTATCGTTVTIHALSSGDADWATAAAASVCSSSCAFKQFYDQAGGGNNLIQSSAGNQFLLDFSCVGSLGCATSAGSSQFYFNATESTATPFSVSTVVNFTTTGVALADVSNTDFAVGYNLFSSGAGTIRYGGTQATFTLSTSANHSIISIMNGASSSVNVDGSITSGLTVGSGADSVQFSIGGFTGGAVFFSGKFFEAGYETGIGFSSGVQTSLCHNQITYWGISGTC